MTNDILSIKSDYLIVGRAASALYLIAKVEKLYGKKVLFPCNVCYAAVYPFVYAGCMPVFCDIELQSGNLTLEGISSRDGYSAVLVPHMYGNPVREIDSIRKYCFERGILLIEDCASAMGAKINGVPCGAFGDYSVFSTGYSKTIDIGGGGVVISDKDLSVMRTLEGSLPRKVAMSEIDEAFFSKLYRLIRNNPAQGLSRYIWDGLHDNMRHMFIYSYPEEEKGRIANSLKRLDEVIKVRHKKNGLYAALLAGVVGVDLYHFLEEAVPWRFCIFVDPPIKGEIIRKMLEKSLPVSDWYPVITEMFGEADVMCYPNAAMFEKRILNFPLLVDNEIIVQICNTIKELL